MQCLYIYNIRTKSRSNHFSAHRLLRKQTAVSPVEAHEAVPLRHARVRVAHDLGSLRDEAEGREGVVEHFFVHVRVQLADEQVGADVVRLGVAKQKERTRSTSRDIYKYKGS